MADYEIRVVDRVSPTIARKMANLSDASAKATLNTQKYQNQLNQSTAHNRFIMNQQRLARDLANANKEANRAIATQGRLAIATMNAAKAAGKAAEITSRYQKSILIGSARIISAISRWMSLLGLGFSLKFVTAFTDSFVNLENKLRNATTSSENLAKATDEVFAAANRARSPVEAMAQTYQRIDLAVRDLGLSQAQAMRITETASKALSLSGATAEETEAALLQLSQAFNKGKLDGDEFRTVMELMPTAADAIAKQLGVTRGELLALAPEGKITAKVMADAFTSVSKVVDDKFSKIGVTIGQSMAVLRNNAMRAFGEFDRAHGITKTLSGLIQDLANNLDKVGDVSKSVGAGLAVAFGVNLVASVASGSSAIKGLYTFIAAHPIGLLATAIGLAAAAVVYFSDEIKVSENGLTSLRDVGVAVWELMRENATYVAQAIGLTWKDLTGDVTQDWTDASINVIAAIKAIWKTAETVLGWIINGSVKMVESVKIAWENLPVVADAIFFKVSDIAISYIQAIIDKVFFLANKIADVGVYLESLGHNSTSGIDDFVGKLGQKISGLRELWTIDGPNVAPSGRSRESTFESLFKGGVDLLENLGTDYAGEFFKGIKEVFTPAGNALEDRIKKNNAKEVFDGMMGDPSKQKLYNAEWYQQRENKYKNKLESDGAGGGSSRVSKIDSGQAVGVLPNAQTWGNTCGKAMVAEIINSHLGTQLKDVNISSINLLDEINSALAKGGSSVRYKDLGNINDPGVVEYWKASNRKGYPVGFASNFEDFGSGRGHIAVGTGFKGGEVEYMDPDKGRMRKTTFNDLRNSPYATRPGGNFVFAPANIDSLPTRHKDETKYLQKKYKDEESAKIKKQKEQEKLALKKQMEYEKELKSLSKQNTDSRNESFEQWKSKQEEIIENNDKIKASMVEYHTALKDETTLLKMASDVAETHAQWLEYSNEFSKNANSLQEDAFKKIVNQNKELEKQRNIRESILSGGSTARNKDLTSALAAGKDLTGQDKIDFTSGLLKDFVGIDTDKLTNEFNTSLGLHQSYYDALDAMKEKQYLNDKQYAQAKKLLDDEVKFQALGAVESMFSDLATLTRTGQKELLTISKAAAIASTIFSTYDAAQQAFKNGVAMGGPGAGGIALGSLLAATAVAQGLARVAQIRAQGTEGFKEGGYTGNVSRNSVAGYVHGQEFVMNAQTTSRIGVDNLQRLQDGAPLQGIPSTNQTQQTIPAPNVNVPVNVTLVPSKEAALSALKGKEGQVLILEAIEKNGSAITRLLS